MSLKQSCFKTVIKSDIKRLWWISALATLFTVLFVAMPLYEYVSYHTPEDFARIFNDEYYYSGRWLMYRLDGTYVFGCMLGAFLSMGLFSYLNNVSSVSFNHALPCKRSTLMAAHSVSALIFITVPIVVNNILCIFAVKDFSTVTPIFVNTGIYFVYALLFFALFTFIGMLTGNTVAQGIFSCVFILLPLFLTSFVVMLCDSYLYGFAGTGFLEDVLINYFYLSPEELMGPKVLVYILLIAVFYGLSLLLYKLRHLENYGEVIAFPQLRWLFKLLFGICSGILGYFYMQAFWDVSNILVMLLFGSIGVIIANMLSNKSFSLRGCKNPIIHNAIFVLAVFVIFNFDITGFESRVPQVNSIVSVTNLNYNYDGVEYAYIDDYNGHQRITRTDFYQAEFTDREDIKLFVDFHKNKIATKHDDEYSSASSISGVPYNVEIEYTLRNGRKMRRAYRLDDSDVDSFLRPVSETAVLRKHRYPVLDGTQKTYTKVEINANNHKNPDDSLLAVYGGSSSEAKKIIDALIKDRIDISFDEYINKMNSTELYTVELFYKVPATDENGKHIMAELSDSYDVSFFDTATLAALESTGSINAENALAFDDIAAVTVHYDYSYNFDKYTGIVSDYGTLGEYGEHVVRVEETKSSEIFNGKLFTDEEDIKTLFGYLTDRNVVNIFDGGTYVFFSIEFTYNGGRKAGYSLYDSVENLPEILHYLKEYIPLER